MSYQQIRVFCVCWGLLLDYCYYLGGNYGFVFYVLVGVQLFYLFFQLWYFFVFLECLVGWKWVDFGNYWYFVWCWFGGLFFWQFVDCFVGE